MYRIILSLVILTMVSHSQMNGQNSATNAGSDTLNRTDAKGHKYGHWIEKTGETTYKGEYLDDKKVKNWISYYPNNAIYKIEFYNNGVKDGISIQFDRKCKISQVEHFKSGLLHGTTIVYSQYNENPVSETEFAYGKKNGVYRQFYDNSKIQEETTYKNDLKNGLSRWNNKNGQRIAEYNYKDGNFDGLQKTFYDNDSIQAETNYMGNLLSGESREYYRNGKVKLSGKYLKGQKAGVWTEYNELGKAEKVVRFKDGVETTKK